MGIGVPLHNSVTGRRRKAPPDVSSEQGGQPPFSLRATSIAK